MHSGATYSAVATAREREMPTRVFLAMFIAGASAVLAPSAWPAVWLCAVCAYQLIDRDITRRIQNYTTEELPRSLKVAYQISTFGSSAVYAAITPYLWFLGGEAGRWFAIMASCGGMLHIALRAYPSRAVLFAGATPHAIALFSMAILYGTTLGGQGPLALSMVIIGAMLYMAHLIAGAQQSGQALSGLISANIEANDAREAAERANAAKSQFLATITHEIRTPMNAVLSAAHLLKRTPLNEEQAEHVAMLTNGGEVLMGLLNDVLDISKIEAGKMELDEADFDLDEALNGLVALYRPRAEGNGVALRLDRCETLPRLVRSDPLRLRQILFNLLSNAVKFTDEGDILIRAGRHGERLYFEVHDSGCGIDDEAMGRLFGAFEQAQAATARSHGGTGLGLSISRKLAEMMGGSLTCESQPGKGSVFRLELPVAEASADAGKRNFSEVGEDGELPFLSILVAEDHDVNRRIVALFLEPLGWRLTMAHNGAEAVEAAGAEPFDAILMDMQMPVMGGIEAGLVIRQGDGPNAAAPIIALTANAMGHHREAWGEVEVAAFLTKPIDPNLLISTLLRAAAKTQPVDERAVA